MTQGSFYRTFTDASPRLCQQLASNAKNILFGLLVCVATFAYAQPTQNLETLETQVKTFLQASYNNQDIAKLEISVNQLDRRLQLSECEQPLNLSLNTNNPSGGNVTVYVQCEAKTPWSIYVPAQVNLYRQLWVASRPLKRGDIVTTVDLSQAVVNLSSIRQGLVTQREHLLGQEVQRPIAKGDTFRASALGAPLVIKRGDLVMIELRSGAISVSAQGTAMANGRIGERIRIRNGQSDRIIHAEVVAAGKVLSII